MEKVSARPEISTRSEAEPRTSREGDAQQTGALAHSVSTLSVFRAS
jgi:hypothetical protein